MHFESRVERRHHLLAHADLFADSYLAITHIEDVTFFQWLKGDHISIFRTDGPLACIRLKPIAIRPSACQLWKASPSIPVEKYLIKNHAADIFLLDLFLTPTPMVGLFFWTLHCTWSYWLDWTTDSQIVQVFGGYTPFEVGHPSHMILNGNFSMRSLFFFSSSWGWCQKFSGICGASSRSDWSKADDGKLLLVSSDFNTFAGEDRQHHFVIYYFFTANMNRFCQYPRVQAAQRVWLCVVPGCVFHFIMCFWIVYGFPYVFSRWLLLRKATNLQMWEFIHV